MYKRKSRLKIKSEPNDSETELKSDLPKDLTTRLPVPSEVSDQVSSIKDESPKSVKVKLVRLAKTSTVNTVSSQSTQSSIDLQSVSSSLSLSPQYHHNSNRQASTLLPQAISFTTESCINLLSKMHSLNSTSTVVTSNTTTDPESVVLGGLSSSISSAHTSDSNHHHSQQQPRTSTIQMKSSQLMENHSNKGSHNSSNDEEPIDCDRDVITSNDGANTNRSLDTNTHLTNETLTNNNNNSNDQRSREKCENLNTENVRLVPNEFGIDHSHQQEGVYDSDNIRHDITDTDIAANNNGSGDGQYLNTPTRSSNPNQFTISSLNRPISAIQSTSSTDVKGLLNNLHLTIHSHFSQFA